MKKNQVKRKAYIRPETRIIAADPVQMVCATVTPNPGSSGSSSSWDAETEHQGGGIGFGDESSVAPAKQRGVWAEDWED